MTGINQGDNIYFLPVHVPEDEAKLDIREYSHIKSEEFEVVVRHAAGETGDAVKSLPLLVAKALAAGPWHSEASITASVWRRRDGRGRILVGRWLILRRRRA
jgi:hypothetical protein